LCFVLKFVRMKFTRVQMNGVTEGVD